MERKLQERMIGAGVLVLALVLFGPMVLDGGSGDQPEVSLPPGQRAEEVHTHTFRMGASTPLHADSRPVPSDQIAVPTEAAAPTVAQPPAAVAMAPEQVAREAAAIAPSAGPGRPTAAEAPRPASAPPAAVARQAWLVQVGTFSQKGNAERLAVSLRERGFEASVSPMVRGSQTLYRVRVGPAGTRDDATALARRLAAAGHSGQVVSR